MATQTVTLQLPMELVQDIERLAAERDTDREMLMEQSLKLLYAPFPVYSDEELIEGIRQADAGLSSPLDEVIDRVRARRG